MADQIRVSGMDLYNIKSGIDCSLCSGSIIFCNAYDLLFRKSARNLSTGFDGKRDADTGYIPILELIADAPA